VLPAGGLVLAYLLLSVLWAVATPPYGGPDERAHAAYVDSLIRFRQFPLLTQGDVELGIEHVYTHEAQQPPLYYLALAPLWSCSQRVGLALPLAGRCFSILLGLASLLLAYAAARVMFPGRVQAHLVTLALLALCPTLHHLTSVVSNESMATLCGAAVAWQTARILRGARTVGHYAFLGVLLGLGLLAKPTLVALAVPITLAVAVHAWRTERAGRHVAARLGPLLAAILLVSGWWYVRNIAVYGTPLPRSSFRPSAPSLAGMAGEEPEDLLMGVLIVAIEVGGSLILPAWLAKATGATSLLGPVQVVVALVPAAWVACRLGRSPRRSRATWAAVLLGAVAWAGLILLSAKCTPLYYFSVPRAGLAQIMMSSALLAYWALAGVTTLASRDKALAPAGLFAISAVSASVLLVAGLIWQFVEVDFEVGLFAGRYWPPLVGCLAVLGGRGLSELTPSDRAAWVWSLVVPLVALSLVAPPLLLTPWLAGPVR
jgi:4-amino-4-deoxy-L-arabinose transferase-like glycosyltransferase